MYTAPQDGPEGGGGQANGPAENTRENSAVRRQTFVWQTPQSPDRNTWVRLKFGNHKFSPELRFNPVVSGVSILLVFAFVSWSILDAKGINTGDVERVCQMLDKRVAKLKNIAFEHYVWCSVGNFPLISEVSAQTVEPLRFASDFRNPRRDTDEPEYNDVTWFTTLFSCGIGVGLFFYGVAEPILHYTGSNRYSADRFAPDNKLAQDAMNVTFYHWGVHAWIVYVVVGMLLGFVAFRKGMPMTMKSCFYPLIGNKIYSWPGDLIDILSVITTLFGVCTSLGLGVIQITAGLNFINEGVGNTTKNQIIAIWCITIFATISVVSGLGKGIRRISEICFTVGMFVMLVVFLLGDPWYTLNLFTQSVGYYFQWVIQLGTHSDAFEMGVPSHGGTDRLRAFEDTTSDGPAQWMDWWTIFYWGWWISWSPFVGTFIAKISRGRSIRQFVNGALTAPVLYSFLWMTIFGGTGLQKERSAAMNELCCPNWNPVALDGSVSVADFHRAYNLSGLPDQDSPDRAIVKSNYGACNTRSGIRFNYSPASIWQAQ
eukprot:sb/3463675/